MMYPAKGTNLALLIGRILEVLYKRTAFYSLHQLNNAKLVPFAGYIMPIQYKGVIFEHNTVRSNVGVFDVSHMCQIIIEGDSAYM